MHFFKLQISYIRFEVIERVKLIECRSGDFQIPCAVIQSHQTKEGVLKPGFQTWISLFGVRFIADVQQLFPF